MAWHIVPQIEREEEVLCKAVRFTPPIRTRGGEEKFIPLRSPILRVIIEQDTTQVKHFITWTPRGAKHGTFTYKWNVPRLANDEYASHDNFWAWMQKNRASVAEEVKAAFEERMQEIRAPKQTKARIKKLTQAEILALVEKGELSPEKAVAMLTKAA